MRPIHTVSTRMNLLSGGLMMAAFHDLSGSLCPYWLHGSETVGRRLFTLFRLAGVSIARPFVNVLQTKLAQEGRFSNFNPSV
jgi:hypothetical protein